MPEWMVDSISSHLSFMTTVVPTMDHRPTVRIVFHRSFWILKSYGM
jgi:hypothetical protein